MKEAENTAELLKVGGGSIILCVGSQKDQEKGREGIYFLLLFKIKLINALM